MYICGHISVKQRHLPDQQVDSGPWVAQLCKNNSGLNSPSGWHLTPATRSLIIFKHFVLQNCFFCSIIVKKSNYLNKITSGVAELAITITHSYTSRGQSPLFILSKVYLKSEWRPSWIFLMHRTWVIPVLASIANRKNIICSLSVPNFVALEEFDPKYP